MWRGEPFMYSPVVNRRRAQNISGRIIKTKGCASSWPVKAVVDGQKTLLSDRLWSEEIKIKQRSITEKILCVFWKQSGSIYLHITLCFCEVQRSQVNRKTFKVHQEKREEAAQRSRDPSDWYRTNKQAHRRTLSPDCINHPESQCWKYLFWNRKLV